MIRWGLAKWNEKNKEALENSIKNDLSSHEFSDIDLVKRVVDCILNDENKEWDSNKIIVIDNGDCIGTFSFLIPEASPKPSERNYFRTYIDYGRCDGCNTLEDIMIICKEIVTSMFCVECEDFINYES